MSWDAAIGALCFGVAMAYGARRSWKEQEAAELAVTNPLTSADIARVRLFGIVKADREAVPCGRWVRYPAAPRLLGYNAFSTLFMTTDAWRRHERAEKKRRGQCCRWTVRR